MSDKSDAEHDDLDEVLVEIDTALVFSISDDRIHSVSVVLTEAQLITIKEVLVARMDEIGRTG